MKRSLFCLLLACCMLAGLLAACGGEAPEEMTAVTIATEEATEATEATVATQATEEKKEAPVETTEAVTEEITEAETEAYYPPVETYAPATEAPVPQTEAQTEPPVDYRSLAMGCVGSSVSTLYSVVGYPPNGSSYANSCNSTDPNVLAEDGELYYNGFTVYTYRENGVETVVDVY